MVIQTQQRKKLKKSNEPSALNSMARNKA
jgi:hypothetical protein